MGYKNSCRNFDVRKNVSTISILNYFIVVEISSNLLKTSLKSINKKIHTS